jgi:hypothetical protein
MLLTKWIQVSALSAGIAVGLMFVPRTLGQSCVSVTTYHNDNLRTGQNLSETVLTPASLSTLKPRFATAGDFDGWAVAQPLYLPQTPMNGGIHDAVFVATLNNSVYAFDGDTGVPYWHWHAAGGPADTAPFTPPSGCTDSAFYKNPSGGAGIVGTPVIDTSFPPPQAPVMYFVTKELDGGTTHAMYLHAIDTSTGLDLTTPVALAGSVVNQLGATVTFSAIDQMARPALLLSNGTIYIGIGSVGCREVPNYGWVMSYTFSLANGFTQQGVFNTTPDLAVAGGGPPYGNGGIWQAGGGLAADASGNVYFETADANNFYHNTKGWQGTDFGDSIVQLTPSLGAPTSSASYFTPYNDRFLYTNDLDLSSTGPVLLPDQPQGSLLPTHILVGYDKSEEIFVVNRDNMGGYTGPKGPNNILQDVQDPTTNSCSTGGVQFTRCSALKGTCGWNAPVYWNNNLYFSSNPGPLLAYGWNPNTTTTPPAPLAACPTVEPGYSSGNYSNSGSPSISANGTSGGILWVVTWLGNRVATLRAFDATNLASQLYQAPVGAVGGYPTPTIANGIVYVASKGRLYAFALKGNASGCKAPKDASSEKSRPAQTAQSTPVARATHP